MNGQHFHIAFALNEAYFPYLAVTLKSFCLHTPKREDVHWSIHLVTECTPQVCFDFFTPLLQERTDISIEVHQIETDRYKKYDKSRFSLYTNLRAELPTLLLDVDKVLYLDTDILFLGDITPLFHLDMGGNSSAMAKDTSIKYYHYIRRHNLPNSKYYNAGVMLMNLSLWRERNNTAKFFDFLEENFDELPFPDQDTINVLFYDEIMELPLEYNITYHNLVDYKFYTSPQREEMRNSLFAPVIVHYAACAPWDTTTPRHPYRNEWWKVAKQLPLPIPKTQKTAFKARLILQAFFILRWLQRRPHNPSISYLQKRYLRCKISQNAPIHRHPLPRNRRS